MILELFLNACILITFITISHQFIKDKEISQNSSTVLKAVIGFCSGLIGIILMLYSVRVTTNVVIDFRYIPILLATKYGDLLYTKYKGLLSPIIATLMIGVFRLLYLGISRASIMGLVAALIIGTGFSIISLLNLPKKNKWIYSITLILLVFSIAILILINDSVLRLKIITIYCFGNLLLTYFMFIYTESLGRIDEFYKRIAAELVIANKELIFQDEEKDKRAAELVIANKELIFQNEEKEKRAAELVIANKELIFQNEEKEKRAAELVIANKELIFQNEEKEKRAAELVIANKEAGTDFLTGLNNVRQFDKSFNSITQLTLRKDDKLSLLYLDIDFFKKINDTYSHSAGDIILKDLATILLNTCRVYDVISRNGGEEFSILLLDCPSSRAIEIAERIRKNVEINKFYISDKVSINITISIGVSTYPDTANKIDNLLEQADTALYEAKRTGRNKVCIG